MGVLPEFREDMLGFVTRCAGEYGDVFAFRLGPKRCILINHPDLIEDVLVTSSRSYTKHFVLRMNPILLGNGMLNSEGDFWLRQRRLAQPAFHRNRIAGYGEVMVAYTERMMDGWRDGETRDIHTEMMQLTLAIVAKTLFDADVAGDAGNVGEALETALHHFSDQFRSLIKLPMFIPTPANVRLKLAVRQLDAIIYRFIEQRRAVGKDRGDLLSMLLQARDEDDGGQMTDKQLRDEMMTLFLAGHETTAIALAWIFYLVAQHPEVEARLMEEIDDVVGNRRPAVTDLPRLRYTEWVVTEGMRLYPPAYMFGREPIQSVKIGDFEIPKGTTVFMSQWVTHRDPRFFDDPEKFQPERWSPERSKAIPKYAYFPFGGGPRACIGNNFALMEACLILATLIRRWHFQLSPDHPVVPQPLMTLRPAFGIKGMLTKRVKD
jgi:cytochrome P450